MNHHHDLHWILSQDAHRVPAGGATRHLVVEVAAPAAATDAEHDRRAGRPPLSLALVIDTSGSMSGAPLAAAREAARGVVAQLSPHDTVTVVSFNTTSRVVADRVRCDHHGQGVLVRAIDQLHALGTTNLARGWLDGCDRVAHDPWREPYGLQPEPASAVQRRVIVLSDGKANRGLCDPAELGHHAAQLRDRGIYTSAVGIGDHYSPTQLEALAEHGGGRLHDAPCGADIVAVLLGELGEILDTAADDLCLHVRPTGGAAVRVLGPYSQDHQGGELRVHLGALVAGARREVVLQVAVPAATGCPGAHGAPGAPGAGGITGAPGSAAAPAVTVEITPAWRAPDGSPRTARSLRGQFEIATVAYAPETGVDPVLGRRVAEMWHRQIRLDATLRNTDRQYRGASDLVAEALPEFREYCRQVPGTEHLVRDLEGLQVRVREHIPERVAKNDIMAMRMCLRSETDFRSARG